MGMRERGGDDGDEGEGGGRRGCGRGGGRVGGGEEGGEGGGGGGGGGGWVRGEGTMVMRCDRLSVHWVGTRLDPYGEGASLSLVLSMGYLGWHKARPFGGRLCMLGMMMMRERGGHDGDEMRGSMGNWVGTRHGPYGEGASLSLGFSMGYLGWHKARPFGERFCMLGMMRMCERSRW